MKKKPDLSEDAEAAEAQNIEKVADEFNFDDPFFAEGDCRDAMLTVIKQAVDWPKLGEHAQRDIVAAVSNAAEAIIKKIARAVHSEGRPEYVAKLEKLVIKDGVQLTLKGDFDTESVDRLAGAQGGHVTVVIQAQEAYGHSRAPAKIDPDQPTLIPEGDADLLAAADPAMRKVVRVESTGDLKVVHAESGVDLGEPTEGEAEAFLAAEDETREQDKS